MRLRMRRLGLTLLEVLFSMGIILVGLVGIGLLVPYAARQANESVAISRSLANGNSALGMANSMAVFAPSEKVPWQLVDDTIPSCGDSNHTVFTSLRDLYTGSDANPGNPAISLFRYQYVTQDLPAAWRFQVNTWPSTDVALRNVAVTNAWVNMNRAIGTCFYMDPLFWGNQEQITTTTKLSNTDWAPFRRTRFPYYSEAYTPTTWTAQYTPRLHRVTLRDSNWPMTATDYRINSGWMKLSASRSVSTAFGGDLNQGPKATGVANSIDPTVPVSDVPIRDFLMTESLTDPLFVPSLIRASAQNTQLVGSWALMICPDDEMPIIPRSLVDSVLPSIDGPVTVHDATTEAIPSLPEHYSVSVVVYGKREPKELNSTFVTEFNAGTQLPKEEMLASVTAKDDQSMTAGIFEIVLNASAGLEPKLRAGDWIMLSRNVVHFESPGTPIVMRQRHRWYRLVNTPDEEQFPMTVRVSGLPWDWTVDEIKSAFRTSTVLGQVLDQHSSTPSPRNDSISVSTRTVATIVPNVIHVFQRTLSR